MKYFLSWGALLSIILAFSGFAHSAQIQVMGKHLRSNGSISDFDVLDGDALSPGDKFQIVIDAEATTYFSIIYVSRDGKAAQIFPQGGSSGRINGATRQYIPDEKNYFSLDINGGRELMFIVTSKSAISNTAKVLSGVRPDMTPEEIYTYLSGKFPAVQKLEITNIGKKLPATSDQVASNLANQLALRYEQAPWSESYVQQNEQRLRKRQDDTIPDAVRRRAQEVRSLLRRPAGTGNKSSLRTVGTPDPTVSPSGKIKRNLASLEAEQREQEVESLRLKKKMAEETRARDAEILAARQAREAAEEEARRLQHERLEAERLDAIRQAEEEELAKELKEKRLAIAEAEEKARKQEELRSKKAQEEKARRKAEADRLARLRDEEQRLAAEAELERLRKLESERKEAERLALEEEKRKKQERLAAKAEAVRLRKIEEQRIEAERLAKEAVEREKAEADRLRKLEEERKEAERLAREAAEREKAERLAAEAEAKRLKELEEQRKEAERLAAKVEAERLRKLEEERKEAERLAKEAARKKEAERLAAEAEAERLRKLEEERREAQRLAAEEAKRQEKARLAAEAEEARLRKLEEARKEAERLAAEEAKRIEEARLAAEAEEARLKKLEEERREAERLAAEEARRKEAARLAAEAEEERLRKLEEERLAAEEAARIDAERKALAEAEAQAMRLQQERELAEQQRVEREQAELEARKVAEQKAQELAEREAEEARRQAEIQAEEARIEAEQAALEEKLRKQKEAELQAEKQGETSEKDGGLFGKVLAFVGGDNQKAEDSASLHPDDQRARDQSTVVVETDSTGAVILQEDTPAQATAFDGQEQAPPVAKVVLQAPDRPLPVKLTAPAPERRTVESTNPVTSELYNQVSSAIVSVSTANDKNASGFILDSQGHILTAWHVIANVDDINVNFMAISGIPRSYKAKVVKFNKFQDLALLRMVDPPEGILPITVSGKELPEAGSQVRVFGQKNGQVWATDDAYITRIAPHFTWFSKNNVIHRGEVLQVDLPQQGKEVGSLVTTMDYQMLGVKSFSGTQTGRTYAVSVRMIREFIQSSDQAKN